MLGPEQTKKLMYASDNASHEADEIESVHASELGRNINVNNRSKLLVIDDSGEDQDPEIMSAMSKFDQY